MFHALRILGVAAVLSLVCVVSQAGDPFRTSSSSGISSSSLSAMGLGGMQAMSHTQATQIRGQGGIVWGNSYANANAGFGNNAGSSDNYVGWGFFVGASGGSGSSASAGTSLFGVPITGGSASAAGYSYASGF